MREVFEGCTVVCIAHRLRCVCRSGHFVIMISPLGRTSQAENLYRTVIDDDKILVLDHGQVVEFDTPEKLMDTEDGWFRKMWEETGEWADLLALASEK